MGLVDVWQGEAERPLERLPGRLERTLRLGAGIAVPYLLIAIAFAELAAGRLEQARDRLEGLVALVEGRDAAMTTWALSPAGGGAAPAGGRRRRVHGAPGPGERRAELGHRLLRDARRASPSAAWPPRAGSGRTPSSTRSRTSTPASRAATRPTCPACLDALAEVAAGLGADEDAVRLFAAAERARAEIGAVRVPPEAEHWAAIEARLREALGDEAYEAARAQGAELSTEDALEWARRARGPRTRPPGGWDSLTPTEVRVVELVAEGLTNPQIAERMFISKETVKTHLAHIFRKLDVHSRAELTARAVERQASAG